jgi:mRNA interferase YafQ
MPRTIKTETAFRRDFKREKAGRHSKILDKLLAQMLALLTVDEPLPPSSRDHQLAGEWKDCRDCHLRPDLVLIYRKANLEGVETLQLLRLGSHSEIFG